MGFREKMIMHKETGLAFTILVMMTIFFSLVQFYQPVVNVINSNFNINFLIITITQVLLPTVVLGIVILVLEKKRASFSAHLLFMSIYLKGYLKIFFGEYNNVIDFVIVLIGVVATVYVVMKLIAHYNEINTYGRGISRIIIVYIILGLLRTYFDYTYELAMTYLVVMLAIIFTAKSKEVLPLVGAIYVISLLNDITRLIFLGKAQFGSYISIALSILIGAYILYQTINLYGELSKDDYNFIN